MQRSRPPEAALAQAVRGYAEHPVVFQQLLRPPGKRLCPEESFWQRLTHGITIAFCAIDWWGSSASSQSACEPPWRRGNPCCRVGMPPRNDEFDSMDRHGLRPRADRWVGGPIVGMRGESRCRQFDIRSGYPGLPRGIGPAVNRGCDCVNDLPGLGRR